MNYKSIFEDSYKDKKVFLTGHTGFKGSWMLAWLYQIGAVVKGYALAPKREDDLFNCIKGDNLCDSVIADIRNSTKLLDEIIAFQPDYIFHFAAQPLVRHSYNEPIETFATNIMGTAHLLDAVKFLEKPCVVIVITTDKVYENKEWYYPYRETDRLGGYDPYSASKACAELIVSSFRNSFFPLHNLDKHKKLLASVRAGNVIGGGDLSDDRIIPDIVKALRQQQGVVLRNPMAVRPWQHVLEPLSGYLLLGALLQQYPDYSGPWNFGPHSDDILTVEEIVKLAIQYWGSGEYSKEPANRHPHEAGLLQLDISKTMNMLKWKPRYNTQESVRMVIDEYKELAKGNAGIIFQHITNYSKND